jgi:flagellar M-ring protein FliF
MDLNRVQLTSESFDPESRVVRSTQTRTEIRPPPTARTARSPPATNCRAAGRTRPRARFSATSATRTKRRSTEISKTTRTEVVEAGRIKKLSVAVLVNGVPRRPRRGGRLSPRPQGTRPDRRAGALSRRHRCRGGDTVEIVNLRFAELPVSADAGVEPGLLASLLAPTKEDILHWIELGVLFVLTLLVLLVVVRPLVRGVVGPPESANGSLRRPPPVRRSGGPDQAAGALPKTRPTECSNSQNQMEKSSSARSKRIGQLVKDNPNATVSVLRQWIHE